MTRRLPTDPAAKREALLQAVRDVAETVAACAADAEVQATLPAPMVAALQQSGLFRLKLPAELGGADADPVTQLEVIEALTYVYPSAGWVVMTNATAIGTIGAFLPDEAIAEIFAGGRVPRAATVGGLNSIAIPVEGGYRLTGRWQFVSGAPHAEWLSLGGRVPGDADGPPLVRRCVVPAASARLHDNWQVAGLKGTGSFDVSVEDVFVPELFTWDASDRMRGRPKRGGPIFLFGLAGFVANEHAAFALGVARRALDVVDDFAQSKRRGRGPAAVTLVDRPVFQRWVGLAELRLAAARALALQVFEQGWQTVSAGITPEPRLEASMRAVAVFCTETGLEIATQAFRYAGGEGLYLDNELQQCLRDLNAGAQHLAVSDVAYEHHGQFLLGLPDASALY